MHSPSVLALVAFAVPSVALKSPRQIADGDDNEQREVPVMTTFEEWYREANAACVALCGLGIDDLPDGPSYDSWEAGISPADYARDQLIDEGFPGELI